MLAEKGYLRLSEEMWCRHSGIQPRKILLSRQFLKSHWSAVRA